MERRTNSKRNSKYVALLALVIVLSICMITLCACNAKVTKKNYDKITNGMSYSAVCDILGDPDVDSEASSYGYSGRTCVWENGKNKAISVVFLNGKVISKSQVGL